jgi:hypothetical protein
MSSAGASDATPGRAAVFLADFFTASSVCRTCFRIALVAFAADFLAVDFLAVDFFVALREVGDPLFRLAMIVAGKVRRTGQCARRRAAGTEAGKEEGRLVWKGRKCPASERWRRAR